ncbi:MAG: hypothetical protein ACOC2F_03730 [Bacteroidota bacterium]
MKRTIFFLIVMVFTLSSTIAFANITDGKSNAEKSADPVKTENKLTDEEIEKMTNRVEEIRQMDKSELTSEEKKELRKELKDIKENVKKAGGTIYIGGATLLIIILVLLLI